MREEARLVEIRNRKRLIKAILRLFSLFQATVFRHEAFGQTEQGIRVIFRCLGLKIEVALFYRNFGRVHFVVQDFCLLQLPLLVICSVSRKRETSNRLQICVAGREPQRVQSRHRARMRHRQLLVACNIFQLLNRCSRFLNLHGFHRQLALAVHVGGLLARDRLEANPVHHVIKLLFVIQDVLRVWERRASLLHDAILICQTARKSDLQHWSATVFAGDGARVRLNQVQLLVLRNLWLDRLLFLQQNGLLKLLHLRLLLY